MSILKVRWAIFEKRFAVEEKAEATEFAQSKVNSNECLVADVVMETSTKSGPVSFTVETTVLHTAR